MRVIVVRHGIAEPQEEGKDDSRRKLTGEGARKTRAVAEAFGRLGCAAEAILASPVLRAWQTAEVVKEVLGGDVGLEEAPWLAEPLDDGAFRRLAARAEACIVLVGHEPFLSEFVGRAIAGARGAHVEMRKAGVASLLFEAEVGPGSGLLEWLAPPRVLVGPDR